MAPAFDTNGVWLVTGCSSGLGESIAKYVYNAGHNIVATARNVSSLDYLPDRPKVLKLSLDVTSPDSITAAIDATVKRFSRLDVVINGAGYGVTTELEGFPEDEARKQVETMFWGPVFLTRESIRVFREVNAPGQGGTIIQISSIGGYLTAEGNSFFHARPNFASTIKYSTRHPAYANDPEAPLSTFIEIVNDPSLPATWADSDKCAAVLFDAVMGQKERPLPTRLNLGADTLPLMRGEVDLYLKEMNDWEEETLNVMPQTGGQNPLVDRLMGKV